VLLLEYFWISAALSARALHAPVFLGSLTRETGPIPAHMHEENLRNKIQESVLHCKKGYRFSHHQPGCHFPNWAGNYLIIPCQKEFG
jgi:hypothetical protein